MVKIALYFPNKGLGEVDCSVPQLGNPGLGGTEYSFLLLIDSLKRYVNGYEVIVYLNEKTRLPYDVEQVLAIDLVTSLELSVKSGNDLFIMKQEHDVSLYKKIASIGQNVIVWGHNFYLSDVAREIARCRNVVLNVFVGKQQYDRYIDHDIIDKSVFIFDMIPPASIQGQRINDKKSVVYLGSLVYSKGFHILARQWKKVLQEVPDAELKVIGTGKVYSRDNQLGVLGIADKDYERLFLPYLQDEKGDILSSVSFLGLLGQEKYDIFLKASIGVVNPSARTETFGMSIIEMNSVGLPVVTVNKNGFPDTVIDRETGILVNNPDVLYKDIVSLLKDEYWNERLGTYAKIVSARYVPELIIKDWLRAFNIALGNEQNVFVRPAGYYSNNLKWIRIVNRFVRKNMRFAFFPAFIDFETFVHKLIR